MIAHDGKSVKKLLTMKVRTKKAIGKAVEEELVVFEFTMSMKNGRINTKPNMAPTIIPNDVLRNSFLEKSIIIHAIQKNAKINIVQKESPTDDANENPVSNIAGTKLFPFLFSVSWKIIKALKHATSPAMW